MKEKYFNIKTIIARIWKSSDQVAFRELFDMFYPKLIHFSYSLIRNSVLAEEIVLDVFSSIWTNRKSLENVRNIESFLFTSVKNKTLNYIRDKQKGLIQLEPDTIDFKYICTSSNPESELITKELVEKIDQAIAALPEKGQLIYRMIKEEGLNYKQVAELLDISSKTVDNHLYIAVKKIRIVIESYRSDEDKNKGTMRLV